MKKYFGFLIVWLAGVEVLAQVAPAASPVASVVPAAAPVAGQWIINLAQAHPWILAVLAVIGSLRLVLKPLFAAGHTFFQQAGLVAWDQKESAIEQSKPMQAVFFILDYLGSIKVPVAQKADAASADAPKAS